MENIITDRHEEHGFLCDRCGEEKPIHAHVYSDVINLYVCAGCALQALALPPTGPGALIVEPLFPVFEEYRIAPESHRVA